MKKYIASVTYKGELTIMEREYKNKAEFYNDLRANGFSVRFITTEENFDADCEKWHEKNEMSKRIHKAIYASDKKLAKNLNMTVSEYRAWVNN